MVLSAYLRTEAPIPAANGDPPTAGSDILIARVEIPTTLDSTDVRIRSTNPSRFQRMERIFYSILFGRTQSTGAKPRWDKEIFIYTCLSRRRKCV